MSFIRKRWLPICVLLMGGCLFGAYAMLRGSVRLPSTTASTPSYVNVVISSGDSQRTLDIRDPTAIVVLQSIVSDGQRTKSEPPSRPEFQVFFPPSGKSSYSYSPSPVWRVAPNRFAWKHDGRATGLNGSLTDFIEWLEIRRVNQLLGHDDSKQREHGERLREISYERHVETLLRIGDSSNGWFAQAGIRELTQFVSRRPQGFEYFSPSGEIRNVRRWSVSDPHRQARDGLLSIVEGCPHPEHQPDQFGTGRTALECLQAIGDRKSADALVEVVEVHQDSEGHPSNRFAGRVLTAMEKLYGIPRVYERGGICGNSSASERARFAAAEAKRLAQAIDKLLTWQRTHVDDTDDEFYDAVVLLWSETLVQLADTPDIIGYGNDRTPAPRLLHLLALGDDVIPALKRRKAEVIDWRETAMLEFCIAYLTGDCDATLVTALLDGDAPQQRVACTIIAAAADPRWNDRVVQLLRSPFPEGDASEAIARRNVAAQALYRAMNVDSLPILQEALNDGFDAEIIHQILNRFEVPVNPY